MIDQDQAAPSRMPEPSIPVAVATARGGAYDLANGGIELSVKGRWTTVPALDVNGDILHITGKWLRIAAIHDEEWLENELTDPESCVQALRQSRTARADIFTFTQKVPGVVPKYSYPLEWFSVAVAHIPSFKEWWESLPQETRKNVRRSQKRGVEIRQQSFGDELIRGIAEVQNETPIRQGRRYPHFGKSFEQVKKDHEGFVDRSDFICAYCGEEIVGFLKLVYRGNVASILQLNSKAAHYDKRPSNALLSKAMELCEARGVSYLTYGRFSYGNKTDSSLQDFKTRNGFRDTLVPRYYIPLTAWGKFCVRAKLYRGPLGILPGGVIAKFVTLRARWYDHKAKS
jgi:Acetyltransferase (GNAT) domain